MGMEQGIRSVRTVYSRNVAGKALPPNFFTINTAKKKVQDIMSEYKQRTCPDV